jgi:hypothetical protein
MTLEIFLKYFIVIIVGLMINFSFSLSVSAVKVVSGWYVQDDQILWGYIWHNGWWRGNAQYGIDDMDKYGQRPNITRNDPKTVGPNRTEDLDKLTDLMVSSGIPGFEHNFGLWYDRRRDNHDKECRCTAFFGLLCDGNAAPPFLEQPWARSGSGRACDGLSKYDLEKFNDWYFERIKEFLKYCDAKGTLLFYNFYFQHAFLENQSHYVDFPWRPGNSVQNTGMPQKIPAANAFYDIAHDERRRLHRAYIRKCLDEFGRFDNVVFLTAHEYTGPASFVEFWLDTIEEWERENGIDVHVGLKATKDVLDKFAADPRVESIDLRYWWYRADGSVFAPGGGEEVPGRFNSMSKESPPVQIYRQVSEYRHKYPDKGIISQIEADRRQTWAFLMGGGSMLVRGQIHYRGLRDPVAYEEPESVPIVKPIYNFINTYLADTLMDARPAPHIIVNDTETIWCLAEEGRNYLVYALNAEKIQLNLHGARGQINCRWFDPSGDMKRPFDESVINGGKFVSLMTPSGDKDWLLWIEVDAESHASP